MTKTTNLYKAIYKEHVIILIPTETSLDALIRALCVVYPQNSKSNRDKLWKENFRGSRVCALRIERGKIEAYSSQGFDGVYGGRMYHRYNKYIMIGDDVIPNSNNIFREGDIK